MDIYFQNFPLIYYVVDINGEPVTKIVRDITTNVRLRRKILENSALFDEYVMDNNETPEIVAYKYYGSVLLQWVVMLCNQRYNLITDFPMNQDSFYAYLEDKYKSVVVPTFPDINSRATYLHLMELENDSSLYNGNSSDAVHWTKETAYKKNTLISYANGYYITTNYGTSEQYFKVRDKNTAVVWTRNTYYPIDTLLVYKNNYYVVTEAGTSDDTDSPLIDGGPDHLTGEVYNGTALLRADILFLQEQTVVDIDSNIQWPLFPTDIQAIEYGDKYYNTYGHKIRTSTMLYHLHHYEDIDGNVINYLNPEPANYPSPIILSDYSETSNAVLWLTRTYYPKGTLIKIDGEERYYTVIEGGETGTNIPTDIIGDIQDGTSILRNVPLYSIITNLEYEERLNEQKRHIKLINKVLLKRILEQLKEAIS